jgi:hypothetical protein
MKLTIELVPQSSFYSNLRSKLPVAQWDILRKDCYKKAGYVCEICGGRGDRWPVECHEIWEYKNIRHIQKLSGLIALCPKCHACKHIGLSQIRGIENDCIEHLMQVNLISRTQAQTLIAEAFVKWEKRSAHSWKIDISYIDSILGKSQ